MHPPKQYIKKMVQSCGKSHEIDPQVHKTMGIQLKVQYAKWSENDPRITFGSPPSTPLPSPLPSVWIKNDPEHLPS